MAKYEKKARFAANQSRGRKESTSSHSYIARRARRRVDAHAHGVDAKAPFDLRLRLGLGRGHLPGAFGKLPVVDMHALVVRVHVDRGWNRHNGAAQHLAHGRLAQDEANDGAFCGFVKGDPARHPVECDEALLIATQEEEARQVLVDTVVDHVPATGRAIVLGAGEKRLMESDWELWRARAMGGKLTRDLE